MMAESTQIFRLSTAKTPRGILGAFRLWPEPVQNSFNQSQQSQGDESESV